MVFAVHVLSMQTVALTVSLASLLHESSPQLSGSDRFSGGKYRDQKILFIRSWRNVGESSKKSSQGVFGFVLWKQSPDF